MQKIKMEMDQLKEETEMHKQELENMTAAKERLS
jgi:hypothetical protein